MMLSPELIDSLLAEPPSSLAGKVSATVGKNGIAAKEVAAACSVSIQAVSGWKRHGRIDKRHIKTLSALTGLPVSWWLPDFDITQVDAPWPFDPWVSYSTISRLSREDLGYLAGRLAEAIKDLPIK